MRVVVDYDLCESNGVCEQILPDVFQINEDEDRMELRVERPPEELRAKVEDAVRRCPKIALAIEET